MCRIPRFRRLLLTWLVALFTTGAGYSYALSVWSSPADLPPIIFIARSHLATRDTIFRNELGPAGQFGTGLTKFAPGSKLVRRNPDGSLFVYTTPGLVDVQSPDVNFDATKIVFAGAKSLHPDSPDFGWRLYEIGVDGSGFHQLTTSDRTIVIPNADQFLNAQEYEPYDDLFPAYLADGRIVFASSRYPLRAHYDGRRTFNLYVIDADGSGLHRITSERGGLLHPTPLPDGRILTTRWWVQFNQPSEKGVYNRIDNADQDQTLPDGTTILANADETFNPAPGRLADGLPIRNAPNTWHLMALNPDGTEFKRLAWTPLAEWSLTTDSGLYDTYQAAQPALVQQGDQLHIAYTSQPDSSMVHSTLKTGIRVARPGVEMLYANATDAIAGLTFAKAWEQDDESGPYALHPWGLPGGQILYSQSQVDSTLPTTGEFNEGSKTFALQGSTLRYELYTMNLDGSGQTPIPLDLASIGAPAADAMDAKPILARPGWRALADTFTAIASDDPRLGNVPNTLAEYGFSLRNRDEIQTATVHNPNVYANPTLDLPFVNNSPPPGSVAVAQIWIDANQFTGAHCYDGWPQPCDTFRPDDQVRAVLWTEVPVTAQGAFTATLPADTPSFVVLRDAAGRIVRNWKRGYLSIAQGNAWARPGETVTCTGCHMGHVSGSIDEVLIEAEGGWTNVAPYAAASASSFFDHNDPDYPAYKPFRPHFANDRRGWTPLPAGGPSAPPSMLTALTALAHQASLTDRVAIVRPALAIRIASTTYQDQETGWISAKGKAAGEWIDLAWPTDVRVQSIRLVGAPPDGGDWNGFGEPAQFGPYAIETGTLQLYLDGAVVGNALAVGRVEPLENGGTLLTLTQPVVIDQVRFTVNTITGRWWWENVAALNEIEVIGMAATAETAPPQAQTQKVFLPMVDR